MSNSYRKKPIRANTGSESEKSDKKEWHQRMRAHSRDLLKKCEVMNDEDLEGVNFPEVRDVSDKWGMSKDGKRYQGEFDPEGGFLNWRGDFQLWWDSKWDYVKRVLMK